MAADAVALGHERVVEVVGRIVGHPDRSQLLRDALRRHLQRLASEHDAREWLAAPLEDGEKLLSEITDWGPAEDWADWADAEG